MIDEPPVARRVTPRAAAFGPPRPPGSPGPIKIARAQIARALV